MLAKIINILFAVTSVTVVKADWFDATWFDGVVQIPLTVDEARGSLWLSDLVIWDEDNNDYIVGGYCTLDNNAAETIIFGPKIHSWWSTNWFTASNADCSSESTEHITEDGASYEGLICRQKMCLGSWVLSAWDDKHTQVCNPN